MSIIEEFDKIVASTATGDLLTCSWHYEALRAIYTDMLKYHFVCTQESSFFRYTDVPCGIPQVCYITASDILLGFTTTDITARPIINITIGLDHKLGVCEWGDDGIARIPGGFLPVCSILYQEIKVDILSEKSCKLFNICATIVAPLAHKEIVAAVAHTNNGIIDEKHIFKLDEKTSELKYDNISTATQQILDSITHANHTDCKVYRSGVEAFKDSSDKQFVIFKVEQPCFKSYDYIIPHTEMMFDIQRSADMLVGFKFSKCCSPKVSIWWDDEIKICDCEWDPVTLIAKLPHVFPVGIIDRLFRARVTCDIETNIYSIYCLVDRDTRDVLHTHDQLMPKFNARIRNSAFELV
jgi:hypothetical protein